MEGLIEGRIVHYVLSQGDVDEITTRRKATGKYMGNAPEMGQHIPMIVVRVWGTDGCVNGQLLLDGYDTFWVTSRDPSVDTDGSGVQVMVAKPFYWHWIERA